MKTQDQLTFLDLELNLGAFAGIAGAGNHHGLTLTDFVGQDHRKYLANDMAFPNLWMSKDLGKIQGIKKSCSIQARL